MRALNNGGFTIIELIIATTVFSIVLLGASAMSIQIGRLYYKGLISASTQNTTRDIIERVSQNLMFNDRDSFRQNYQSLGDDAPTNPASSPPTSPSENGAFTICIGSNRYTYWLGKKVGGQNHGLVVDSPSDGSSCNVGDGSSGTELLGENMRLTEFRVSRSSGDPSIYQLNIKIAYGDDDLLTTYDQQSNAIDMRNLPSTLCKSGTPGSSYCATSSLDTVVKSRLE